MKLSSYVVRRPVCFLIFLMMTVLSLAGLLIALWIKRVATIEHEVRLISHNTVNQELLSRIHKNIVQAFFLLIATTGAMVITICNFVYLIVRAARREMYLRGALIKQMEATQQSERKSMNKSIAFASASHDIRASLAGIRGLIDISRDVIYKRDPLRSELIGNLQHMETCIKDLEGILNSILDTSKIEAGKMQLDEEEFDVEQLLEDVVDLFHPVGMKKGVDVILDPNDGSITKNHRVTGDRGKLKQILSNLLSNAVKFTPEGHVVVRAWAKKPSLDDRILAASSGSSNFVRFLLCFLFKLEKPTIKSGVVDAVQRDPNRMEFVFEVNDTGKGIPKEKQSSVFENYVQVKETAHKLGGTGLGLGIVQSLVRLLGGEIRIVDKGFGEKGTCMRFDVFFTRCRTDVSRDNPPPEDVESARDYVTTPSLRRSGSVLRHHSPKTERSQILLFIQNPKRSVVVQSFMQKLGLRVHVVKQHNQLSPTLRKLKQKLNWSHHSSPSRSDVYSRSDGCISRASSTRSKEVPLSSLDGTNDIPLSQKRAIAWFILIVIDISSISFGEISRIVAEFRRDLNENACVRVVWLDPPGGGGMSSNNLGGLDEDKLPSSDLIVSKPFHGSRLYRIIGLLPEFGGVVPRTRAESTMSLDSVRVEETKSEIEGVEGSEERKPLTGKRVLIADDSTLSRITAKHVASSVGAEVDLCENGEDAVELVCKSLNDQMVTFDCILMDCEMPKMNGAEATKRIREAEKSYGVHSRIFAFTAHDKGEEVDNMIRAGVDGYITKPLNREKLFRALSVNTEKNIV